MRLHMPDRATEISLVAILAVAVNLWLGLQGHSWADWAYEARPSVNALLAGHVNAFFRLAPAYGGSLLLRAPFMELARLCGGGPVAIYRAGAIPCTAAAVGLALWLSAQQRRRGRGFAEQAATVAMCIAGPVAVIALQQGHPEELLGAVLCAAAVLCAQRDHAIWSGFLVGLAIANKEWGVLALGPVLVALPRHRLRSFAAMLVTAGALVAPFMLVRAGGFASQTTAVALHATGYFRQEQLWWFFGTPAADGARMAPAWIPSVGHVLPIVLMLPLTLAYAVRLRRSPERWRADALLLLALLLLLRCALDPWDVIYYPLPFVTALLAWDTTISDRPPLISLSATLLAWYVFQGAMYTFDYRQDALGAVFAVVTVPAICAIVFRLMTGSAPAVPAAFAVGPPDSAASARG
jgi:hypothetical protein